MKKVLTIVTFFVLVFLIQTNIIYATELDCNAYLSSGSSKDNVKDLQLKLNQTMSCNLSVDGVFGSLTSSCTKRFQEKYDLDVDGIVGPKTCTKLNNLTKSIDYNNNAYSLTEVNIRKKATTKSKILKTITKATEINIISKVNDWYKIKLGQNNYGYIRSDLVTRNIIIVDISEQVLNYYIDGKNILTAPVITGMLNNHDTPIGSYILNVDNLSKNQILRGVNDDGSKYASFVDYWMPFIMDRGIGFHDATWRSKSSFKPTTYINNGSHGCINMQHADAKKLFENIKEDAAVIIRY